ncbi:sugar-binding transcriptional regulator [Nesterenkonia flava]|uniref:Sugar-binding domain-containing protein n=1 Tax=Nesterenkonia flava TaxID=469799 RepID=A0ABU1FW64_9MICC|nr:sugar-binding domain-containing protein [Nesterenkonia flava]MDR5712924.1 sugar-binding domain-containing protein [Nesterenkonia flava]
MADAREMALMVELASEHYLQERSKVEIAQRHGLSRFQVARLLEAAREEGIVQIRIVDPLDAGATHSELAEALGISTVTVAAQRSGESLRPALARHAAALLQQRLHEGARLGVAWSRTLMHLPEHLSALPAVDVVQLVGPLSAPGTTTAASTGLIHALGSLAGGQVWPLPTPLILDSEEVAASLRGMDEVRAALEAADDLDLAVVSIGAWGEGASTLWGRFSEDERARAQAAGVVAECSGILLTAEGEVARTGLESRVIGVKPEQLRRTRVIGLAPALAHPEAVVAAARAGFVDELVLSEELATRVSAHLSKN